MAITLQTAASYPVGFFNTGSSDDFSGTEELHAAVTGKSIFIDHVIIKNGATARTVTISAGETAGAVTTALMGPISLVIAQTIDIPLRRPIKLAAATSLTVDASGGSVGTVVIVEGFIR